MHCSYTILLIKTIFSSGINCNYKVEENEEKNRKFVQNFEKCGIIWVLIHEIPTQYMFIQH